MKILKATRSVDEKSFQPIVTFELQTYIEYTQDLNETDENKIALKFYNDFKAALEEFNKNSLKQDER